MKEGRKPNRLINEKSPYLLQHAYNPVDWFPWGEEAFAKARREDKPIFLSVGYSTCYWCHVMEREVFENDSIARLINEKLVPIKVDREERPDIDRVYMTAVQAMTGSGGWPMSVFLTPDLEPFFGTTYIPPRSQDGRPGFPEIVDQISNLWKTNRDTIFESGKQVTRYIKSAAGSTPGVPVSESILDTAFRQFVQSYDAREGGFGTGMKFPRPVSFAMLLRYYARTGNAQALQMTLGTLRAMARGGVYDHIGGGFHRYSVDPAWRVPHFEKMLYDQAQLVVSYLEAYQVTHEPALAAVAHGVLDYLIGNLRDKEGGFYSAEDAESAPDPSRPDEKREGAYYLWTESEIQEVLGEAAAVFGFCYGVEGAGNAPHDPMNVFTGQNILYLARSPEEAARRFDRPVEEITQILRSSRLKLFYRREGRPKPHLDDKIITAWNGLAISAFARAYQIFGEERFLKGAEAAADFIMTTLVNPETGTLYRRYRGGESRFEGSLQDYAFLIQGLIDLYEASFSIRRLEDALRLTQTEIALFWDPADGGFFDAVGNDPSLLIRTKEDYDGAEPTGNAIAALNLLRLGHMTANTEWKEMAQKAVNAFGSRLQRMPEVAPQMLVAYDWLLSTPAEIIIAGPANAPSTRELLREVHARFLPHSILLLADGGEGQARLQTRLPFLEGMRMIGGKAAAYICEGYACRLPTADRAVVAEILGQAGRPRIQQ